MARVLHRHLIPDFGSFASITRRFDSFKNFSTTTNMPAQTLNTVEYTSLSDAELDALKNTDRKTLFNNISCPFGHRALWTAAEVDAPVQIVEVGLYNDMPQSYIETFNRYHTVPFLLDNGNAVYESAIIAQYLDVKYNNGKFHSLDNPEDAALSQLLAAKFELGPIFALLRNNDPAKKEQLENNLKEAFGEAERIYRENAAAYRSKGPYLLGDKFSQAEIHIVPFLFRFSLGLKHFRDFDILADFPLLSAAFEAAIERPAFKLTTREPEFYIKSLAKFVQ
ncbi:glutathione transferase family protein [Thraustotheca clavata]|uniref:Glutathione transferase family protein n=1 Tax=Thraustotheca clavata TaxID=74557 RepID=A0A1V9ZY30_9STRA|nr:glutathione transferase family protein [Thraustotheca clavata]